MVEEGQEVLGKGGSGQESVNDGRWKRIKSNVIQSKHELGSQSSE